MSESGSVPPEGTPKDRHEPRGRKPNDQLPPSRAREVQRAFRLRRAEHLASLEERILHLENENSQLRLLLNLPEGERTRIGSGPTGRGKALKEGGVPMSERVRARKEARDRERRAKGLPEAESSDMSDRGRDSATLSPGASGTASAPHSAAISIHHHNPTPPNLSLFGNPQDTSAPFNYNLPLPFNLPVSPDNAFSDFDAASLFKSAPTPDSAPGSSIFKPPSVHSSATPNFAAMFSLFDTSSSDHTSHAAESSRRSPISPPLTQPQPQHQTQTQSSHPPTQPDLLTRLKSCCHLSDSHVVNDPGLLIFATRLCQSFPCGFAGVHPDGHATVSDTEHLLLEDSWRALKTALDPGGEADGENRINTGKMAAELVIRAAHSRGSGGWILCRFREGMTIKRVLVAGLVQGMGGKFE